MRVGMEKDDSARLQRSRHYLRGFESSGEHLFRKAGLELYTIVSARLHHREPSAAYPIHFRGFPIDHTPLKI